MQPASLADMGVGRDEGYGCCGQCSAKLSKIYGRARSINICTVYKYISIHIICTI